MPKERVATGEGTGMEDARENQDEEFGRGDEEFGGGPGAEEYGEKPNLAGKEGVVFEGDRAEEEAAETAAQERRLLGESGPGTTEGLEEGGEESGEESP